MSTKRYPIEPLAEALGVTLGIEGNPNDDALLVGYAHLAEALGIDSFETVRTQRKRRLSDRQADHHACAIGMHPNDIWPTWYDDAHPDRWWCNCPNPTIVHRHCDTCDGYIRPNVNPVADDHRAWPRSSPTTKNNASSNSSNKARAEHRSPRRPAEASAA